MNAAANDYVYVELGLNSCELGCVVAGTKHAFGTVPGFRFRSGSAYWLECGTTGGGRVFRVWENSTPILTYTDASSVSQLDANHRYSGLGTYAYSNVLYAIVPAQASALAFVDNTPAPTVGSGFRRTRTSTSTANISTTTNTQLPGSWFDSPDRITDDLHYDHGTNKLTVSVAGWYAVTISVLVDDNVGTSFFLCPVLYQNNSVVQLGNTIYYPSGASERARAATTFIVYCAKDDYLEPGYNASQTSSNSLTGEGGGVECYFEAVFINNKKPSA
jgi:hypothetical protein